MNGQRWVRILHLCRTGTAAAIYVSKGHPESWRQIGEFVGEFSDDREIAGESEDAMNAIEECELYDDLLDTSDGTPTGDLLRGLHLPAPSAGLTDAQARLGLFAALLKLAMFGIAFHICEHCSAQEAYRILIEKVCKECKVFPEMMGTGFAQHFATSDYCPRCQEGPML